jgi:hypothetical protein
MKTDNKPVKGEPFHYNGYVVWWLADPMRDEAEYLFYLGDRLVERFTVTREALRTFVPESCDAMPFIWELFLVAQGKKEKIVHVPEQNAIESAVFEITIKRLPKEE